MDKSEVFDYNTNIQSTKSGEAPLDPNHTHFVLVDNSQLNKFGGEIEFRGRLEMEIVSYYKSGGLDPRGEEVPIVVLVLEGGPGTFRTVLNSVRNGSPCVFVEGSGGCADIYAHVLSRLTIKFQNSKAEKLRAYFIFKLTLIPSNL
jgi:transient receptor potential cation channel subfamily M protein 2